MNIKSLLLGSAAALVAVTGARAADVIIPVEPEPVDYVRVCDVYGTGFFYIPGTETCIRVSGYARLQLNAVGEQFNAEGDDYIAGSYVRGRINFDVREETELGTLRGYVRLQGQNRFGKGPGSFDDFLDDSTASGFSAVNNQFALGGTGDGPVAFDEAYIQLGGLTLGYLDSLWAQRDGLLTDTDFSVGDFQSNRISYTFAADGFSAAVSLEDDGTGDFAPDVVGQLAYEGGFGSAYISGVYDEESQAFRTEFDPFLFDAFGVAVDPFPLFVNPDDADDGAFALKGGISLTDLIAAESELKIEGHYAFDPTIFAADDVIITFGPTPIGLDISAIPIEYQIGAGYAQGFGRLGIAVSGAYGETFDLFTLTGGDLDNIGSADFYELGLNVGYEVTSNFEVLGEVTYREVGLDDDEGRFDNFDQTAGFLRFQRNF